MAPAKFTENCKSFMKTKLFILLSLSLLLGFNSFAQTAEFSEAEGSGTSSAGGFAKWNFTLGGNAYEIADSGKGTRTSGAKRATKFTLPVGAGETVSRLYCAEQKNDLILLYEISAGGEGAAYIVRFDAAALKPKWQANISGFNLGKGLIENNFAYLTAIGFVAKINLLTGKYVWKHDNLYGFKRNTGAFNSFETPELDGGNVVFTEKTFDNQTNIIVVNKTNGKIVRTIIGK